jgi:hypothetical protein
MRIERAPGQTSLLEMLDRVLDKGLVIDDWVGASPINWKSVLVVEPRVVVSSAPVPKVVEGSPGVGTFGSATSSRSALLRGDADTERHLEGAQD